MGKLRGNSLIFKSALIMMTMK